MPRECSSRPHPRSRAGGAASGGKNKRRQRTPGRASTAGAGRAWRATEAPWRAKARRQSRLVDGAAGRSELRLQRKRAERLFVLGEVVAENVEQRLGLLRTEVDALEVFHLDLCGRLLMHGADRKSTRLNSS